MVTINTAILCVYIYKYRETERERERESERLHNLNVDKYRAIMSYGPCGGTCETTFSEALDPKMWKVNQCQQLPGVREWEEQY